MKELITLGILLLCTRAQGQNNIAPTDQFKVTGKVKQEITISIADLKAYPSEKIKAVIIKNHRDERKGTINGLKGIPIAEILKRIEIDADSPKSLSEYYLIFEASDGYKVVYSWNELFNADTGRHTYIVTQKNGVGIEDMAERIMIITPNDTQTGRRYIKCLSRIIVKRAD